MSNDKDIFDKIKAVESFAESLKTRSRFESDRIGVLGSDNIVADFIGSSGMENRVLKLENDFQKLDQVLKQKIARLESTIERVEKELLLAFGGINNNRDLLAKMSISISHSKIEIEEKLASAIIVSQQHFDNAANQLLNCSAELSECQTNFDNRLLELKTIIANS